MDVIHTCIWVDDLEKARAFYVDGLGLTETDSFTVDGTANVFVGGETAEIQFKHNPEQTIDSSRDRSRLDHIAIGVDDLDTTLERLTETTNCPVIDGPRTVEAAAAYVAFVEGPQGYVVELVEPIAA